MRILVGAVFSKLGVDMNRIRKIHRLLAAKKWTRSRSLIASATVRDGCVLFHDKGNSLIRRGEFYEPETRQALFALCALDRLRGRLRQVADIGANIGLQTVFLARQFPQTLIHAYDPSPQSIRYLQATIEYNNLVNVNLHGCALGVTVGKAELYTWGKESSADSLRNTHRVPDHIWPIIVKVPVTTLDQQFYEGIRPTVIKIDCEGGEIDVLRGGSNMFQVLRPLVVAEFSPLNMPAFGVVAVDLFAWLNGHEYRLYTLSFEPIHTEASLVVTQREHENFIMIPTELIKEVEALKH